MSLYDAAFFQDVRPLRTTCPCSVCSGRLTRESSVSVRMKSTGPCASNPGPSDNSPFKEGPGCHCFLCRDCGCYMHVGSIEQCPCLNNLQSQRPLAPSERDARVSNVGGRSEEGFHSSCTCKDRMTLITAAALAAPGPRSQPPASAGGGRFTDETANSKTNFSGEKWFVAPACPTSPALRLLLSL